MSQRARRHTSLRAAIGDNHRLATPDERIVHRRLATLPTVFTVDAAVAVCALEPLHRDRVVDLLAGLVRRSLLATAPSMHPGGATSFRRLVALHAHAEEALHLTDEGPVVRAARDRWVLDVIASGPRGGRRGQAQWYDRLDENASTILLVLTGLVADPSSPPSDAALLAVTRLTVYWYDRRRGADALHWLPLAAGVAGGERLADHPDPEAWLS